DRDVTHRWIATTIITLAMGVGISVLPSAMAGNANNNDDPAEASRIQVYEKAAPAVVTLNALVNGGPSSGSGVLVSASGLVLTSRHVIGDASTVYVSLADGRYFQGRVLGR